MTRPIHHLRRHRRRRQVDPHRRRSPSALRARGPARRLHARAGRHAARRAAARAAAARRRWTASTETLLVFAARRDHIERVHRAGAGARRRPCSATASPTRPSPTRAPAAARTSAAARSSRRWVQAGLQPDLTLWFDVEPALAARAAPRRAPPTASRPRTSPSSSAFAPATWRGCGERRSGSCASTPRAGRGAAQVERAAALEPQAGARARRSAERRRRRAGAALARRAAAARARDAARACAADPRRRAASASSSSRWRSRRAGCARRPIAPLVDRPCGRCASCQLRRGALASRPAGARARGAARSRSAGTSAATTGEDGEARAASASRARRSASRRCAPRSPSRTTTSARGRGKVVVIHPAERMNAIAANAFLKTLEEPAGDARFVLCSRRARRLLPTIRSRCQQRRARRCRRRADAEAWLARAGRRRARRAARRQRRPAAGRARPAPSAASTPPRGSRCRRRWPRGDAAALRGWPLAARRSMRCRSSATTPRRSPAARAPRYFPRDRVAAGARSRRACCAGRASWRASPPRPSTPGTSTWWSKAWSSRAGKR